MSDVPKLRCCRPHVQPFPSGPTWAHSRNCRGITSKGTRVAGQKVEGTRVALPRPVRSYARHMTLVEMHQPAPRIALSGGDPERCPAHPLEGRWTCGACASE